MAFGKLIDVEQDFFAGKVAIVVRRLNGKRIKAVAVGTAGVDGVILAGLETAVVPVAVIARRDAAVVLLDAGDDFVVELVFQRRKRREDGIGVGVFRVEIGEHLCVFAGVVAQPVVFILPLAMRRGDSVRAFFGVGRGLRVQGVHRQYQGEKERFEVHGGLVVERGGHDSRRECATARAGLGCCGYWRAV